MIYRFGGYSRYLNDRARDRQEEIHIVPGIRNEISPFGEICKDAESDLKVEGKGYREFDTLEQVECGI
jgi:hypothetical protein